MDMFGNLGLALRFLREKRGLTQSELARRAGVGKSQLSKYESGKERPKFDSLGKLLEILELRAADFFALADLLDTAEARIAGSGVQVELHRFTGASLLPPEIQTEFERLLRTVGALHTRVVFTYLRLDEETLRAK